MKTIQASVFALVLTGLTVASARADQPKMDEALKHLSRARAALVDAKSNKGGHRLKAIELIDQAIAQVQRGKKAAN